MPREAGVGYDRDQSLQRLSNGSLTALLGMTETSPITHINPDEDMRVGSIGQLLSGMEYKVARKAAGGALVCGRRSLCSGSL
jgi:long-subunit acyl-CoA synthetase (AMP-forming)